ncbi:MAG: T9SS type A sorting domain-containing protein [Candidatus Marinimicrobia bacterium]|nr:T9SS type A sorting domain-containing protein [Candidatus Neomarinimicrobiota bacterium]
MMKSKLQISLLVAITIAFAGLFVSPIYAQDDDVRYLAKNTGFGLTDIDKNGFSEILMFDDNSGFVRVYEVTDTNTIVFVKEWQPSPTNWVEGATVKSQIPQADFDSNGVFELYLSDTKGNSWIITPEGDVATMFDDVNWTRLHDWKVGLIFDEDYNEGGEVRGNLIGDVDGDGKPDIYMAGNNFGAILDIEWDGGTTGAVTDGDNYSYFKTFIDGGKVDEFRFARPANIQLADMDGDGLQEILAIVPWSGENPVDNLLGLYVFEQDASSVGVNAALTNVWHEAADSIFTRGYVLTGGGSLRAEVDIDKDGKGEFLAYEQDAAQHIIYLFEATSDNTWEVVWTYQFGVDNDGTTGLFGNERGIMVMDIDGDGKEEIVVIIDTKPEDDSETGEFLVGGYIFEWDGTGTSVADNNGLPSTPTATFDPPRDVLGHTQLENNSLVWDVDNDGVDELVLTHRGGNGMFLSVISLSPKTAGDVSSGVDVFVEFEETFVFVGVDDARSAQTPREFSLGQNYPNPFNPSTSIMYDVPLTSNVSLIIYDILGRNVRTLLNEQRNAGSYSVEWDGKNSNGLLVTSGIYFYRLEAGEFAVTKKMVLLK